MIDIFKRKLVFQQKKESHEVVGKSTMYKENEITDFRFSIVKQNEENLLINLRNKVENSNSQTENLINSINSIANRIEEQIEHIYSVVDEISHYSVMAEELYASSSDSYKMASKTLNVVEDGN